MTETDSNNSNYNNFQNDLELIVNKITKLFDSNRYYNLFELRKLAKNLRFNLPGRYSLRTIRIISKIFVKNLPQQFFARRKVIGEVIIDYLKGDLKKKILAKLREINNKDETLDKSLAAAGAATEKITHEIISNFGSRAIPIARVIPGSNVNVIKCRITDSFQQIKDINGKYVTLKPFEGVKVLGQIGNIYTVNDTPNNILAPTMISDSTDEIDKQTIIELDSRIADVYVRKVIDGKIKKKELGNAPPTTTDIYLATDKDIEVFFDISPENPVCFVKTIGHLSFIPKFDLLRLLRRHVYILGITDSGKGFLANSFLLSCVGYTIRIAPDEDRKVGCLYFDFTGQFANDSYGFFEAWTSESGSDPRVIIPGDEIGIHTPEDLIEIFFRKYRILDLGFASQKIAGMRRYLLSRITINSTFSDFQRELPCAIRNTYSGNPTNHLERIESHLEAMGSSIWNEEIEPLKSPDLFVNIDNNLRNGKFVIVDLSRIREREYKPGVVYRILKFLDELLNENFSNTQREMDYPVFVGLDEAHNFAGATSNLRQGYYVDECNNLIARMCAEDRKTGLCMVIITQRLAWTNRDVRANMGLWCVSKINSVDEDQAKKCMGNHDFINYRYRAFRLFGDSSPIPPFPTRALIPSELAKLKKKVGSKFGK
ncbi:hypothetical protein LCGC14_0505400 [marine sediment metagenome]|uniref:Helicase HerA central domain-containing protein n=1 Tax=marine sediment metagenome TaxID=412755 RepID=A0A0F9S2K4_9ZZZZ|nr:MAG: AAA-like domain protein [Candidatus Lokiarchaeum sp. GC14_75]